MKLFCVVCRTEIEPERAAKRSVVCSPACRNELNKFRRALVAGRRCIICYKPSTPEERRSFAAWRKQHPELAPKPIGRPKKDEKPQQEASE